MSQKSEEINDYDCNSRKNFRDLTNWWIKNAFTELDPFTTPVINNLKDEKRYKIPDDGYVSTTVRPSIQLYHSNCSKASSKKPKQNVLYLNRKFVKTPRNEVKKLFCHNLTAEAAIKRYTDLNAYSSYRKKKVDHRLIEQAFTSNRSRPDHPQIRGKSPILTYSEKFIERNRSIKNLKEDGDKNVLGSIKNKPKPSIAFKILRSKTKLTTPKGALANTALAANFKEPSNKTSDNNFNGQISIENNDEERKDAKKNYLRQNQIMLGNKSKIIKNQQNENNTKIQGNNEIKSKIPEKVNTPSVSSKLINSVTSLSIIKKNRNIKEKCTYIKRKIPERKPLPVSILEVGKLPTVLLPSKEQISKKTITITTPKPFITNKKLSNECKFKYLWSDKNLNRDVEGKEVGQEMLPGMLLEAIKSRRIKKNKRRDIFLWN